MEPNSKTNTKSKIVGIILTLIGVAGLVYAAISQFTNGMAKNPVAGMLLFSLIIIFIGVAQLFKKHPDQY